MPKKKIEKALEEEVATPSEEVKDEAAEEAVEETPTEAVAEEEKSEEVKEEATEEAAEESAEEKVDSEVEEVASELESKLADAVAKKVIKQLQRDHEKTVAAKQVKKEFMSTAQVKEQKVEIYRKKNGEVVSLEKSGVKLLGKWLGAWAQKDFSEARKFLQEINTKFEPLVVGTDAEGGYLSPTIWTNILIDIRNDMAVIRPNATRSDLSGAGDTFNFNQVATQPRVSWVGENVAKSTTSMTFNQGALTPYKLAAIASLSLELEQDSATAVIPLIMKQLADAITKEEDRVFMVGTGSSQPTGIDAYSFTTINAAFALSYNTFISAYYRLPQAYRDRAVWIMNSRAIAVARSIADTNGRPIFMEGSNSVLTGRPTWTILGAPVLEQNDVASSKIFFGDLSQYYIGDKMNMTMRQSTEASVAGRSAFEYNLTHILVEERVDAELLDTRSFVEISNVNAS
jgi:HK97 family phage major capsid protein